MGPGRVSPHSQVDGPISSLNRRIELCYVVVNCAGRKRRGVGNELLIVVTINSLIGHLNPCYCLLIGVFRTILS